MPYDYGINPAQDAAELRKLMARVADLERQAMQQRELNYGQRAQISAYTSGSPTFTVTFESGDTAQVRMAIDTGYTPQVGHYGLVIVTPDACWWVGRDSVP